MLFNVCIDQLFSREVEYYSRTTQTQIPYKTRRSIRPSIAQVRGASNNLQQPQRVGCDITYPSHNSKLVPSAYTIIVHYTSY